MLNEKTEDHTLISVHMKSSIYNTDSFHNMPLLLDLQISG